MKNTATRLLSLSSLLASGIPVLAWGEMERHPVSMGTSLDFGQIVKGRFFDKPEDSIADGQVLTRTGVFLTEGGTYNKRLTIQFTLGGLYWSLLPQIRNEFEKRLVYFGAGVGQAQAIYVFGDTEKPWGKLQVGLFPIKYNPDAKNLGEYLYRSGTYPGSLFTGGWSFLNSAAYLSQGLRFSVTTLGGKLVQDFTLTQERDIEPIHDISPGYMLTWKPAPFFEFGTGVVWAHGIPLKPDSVLTPRKNRNAYVLASGKPLAYNDTGAVNQIQAKHYVSTDPRVKADNDPCLTFDPSDDPDPANPCYDPDFIGITANGIPGEQLGYYTFKGFKTMARVSLDLGVLLGMRETLGSDGFKLYGEWALLGVENRPFFYEDKTERMPMMIGVNVPTFKLLDLLSVELEYHKSRFPNTIQGAFDNQYPIPWNSRVVDFAVYDSAKAEFKKDDWKWSVHARRKIRPGLTLYAQAASDHLRHMTTDGAGQFRPMYEPTTKQPGQWYYVLRLEIGI